MLPFISFLAILPLALALRAPSTSDASLTSFAHADAATKGDLVRLPRHDSTVYDTTLATRTTPILPNIQLGASFCVTLGANLYLETGLTLGAGICLCFDAEVDVMAAGSLITVVASSGETIRGALALKIRDSVIANLFGIDSVTDYVAKLLNGEIFALTVGAGICLQLDLFVSHTVHDFTKVGQCCARKCALNYVDDGYGNCVCPTANQCGTTCLSGPAISCNGQCLLAAEYTCPSGMPKAVVIEKRRHMSSECGAYGHEMCAVAGSSGYECINTMVDLESCGGCVYTERGQPQGTDCTALPQVDEVLCHHGACLVLSCERGYTPSQNGTACVDIHQSVGQGKGKGKGKMGSAAGLVIAAIDGSIF